VQVRLDLSLPRDARYVGFLRNVAQRMLKEVRAPADLVPLRRKGKGSNRRNACFELPVGTVSQLEWKTESSRRDVLGAHRPALESLATSRGLAERVRFDGPVPNAALLAYSAGADVGLCLIRNSSRSYYLSLPNKLFEYVMAGVPQVTSDFPEMGAVVRRYGVGEVCDPDDPGSVARAVRRIVDDPDAAAAAELPWGAEEPRLLALYDSIR
jgi:glycosyltransferase involved in cell wall biosynthesis